MTSLNNKYTNNRSMNGLINIYADNIEATNSTINDTLIVDGKNINAVANQVDTNKINLTGITYTATPTPTTNISNKLIVSSIDATNTSVFRANLNILGTGTIFGPMQVDSTININGNFNSFGTTNKFNNDLEVSKILYVGKNSTTQISSVDVNGTIYIRDPSDPNNVYMRIYYEPALYGFTFSSEIGRYMNFRLKKPGGGYDLFYFSSGQLYASMGVYVDNWLNVSFNKQLTLGDNNGSVYYGSSMSYIPSSGVTDGLVIINKGFLNSTAYYTNFKNVNLTNNEVFVFRMNYNNIWSKVPHTMESTLTLSGNLIANSINITPVELSYLSGVTSNIQTQLNNKLSLTGGTITGTLVASGTTNLDTTYINGALTASFYSYFNNDINITGSAKIIVNSTTGITQNQLSYLSGVTSNIQTQLNNKLSLSGGTLTGDITFSDSSVQSTAYTTADDTKLQAIGGITTSTVVGNTNLVTGNILSCGSMSLTAGTYLITINAYLNVITGTTTINGMAAAFSTSSTSFTQAIGAQQDGGGFIWPVASGWSLNSTNPVVVTSTTTYYMLVRATFGTAARLRFLSSNSAFTATRIA